MNWTFYFWCVCTILFPIQIYNIWRYKVKTFINWISFVLTILIVSFNLYFILTYLGLPHAG